MATYVLRIEGVNFDATLYDTNDLAVIRGASVLLEQAGDRAAAVVRNCLGRDAEPLWRGASRSVFRLTTDEDGAARVEQAVSLALRQEPWRHLSFVVAVAPDEPAATARNRTAQFGQWTVPNSVNGAALRQCALDGVRAATKNDHVKGWLSASTSARLECGRYARANFFQDGRRGCEDFATMIAEPPVHLPDAVKRKIAVVHLDGDGFGRIARAAGADVFAKHLTALMERLQARLTDDAARSERHENRGPDQRRRLEVLVWGGDDITLVVPAWRLLGMLAGMLQELATWTVDGHRLTFTAGAVVAHYKSPVRRLVRLAHDAVDATKDALRTAGATNRFTIDVFESAVPGEDGLQAHRRRVFGDDVGAESLTFPGEAAPALIQQLRDWRLEGGSERPSRSKLVEALREGYTATSASEGRDALLDAALRDYALRKFDRGEAALEYLELPVMAGVARPRWLDLRLVLEFWDYAAEVEP